MVDARTQRMLEPSRAEMNRPSFPIDICRSIWVLSTAMGLLGHLTWGADLSDPSQVMKWLETSYWTLSLGSVAALTWLDQPRARQVSHGIAGATLLAYAYYLRLPVLLGHSHSLAYHAGLTRFFASTGWYFGAALGLPLAAIAGLIWVVLVSFWAANQTELSLTFFGCSAELKAGIRHGIFAFFLLLLGLLLLRYATGSISPLPSL